MYGMQRELQGPLAAIVTRDVCGRGASGRAGCTANKTGYFLFEARRLTLGLGQVYLRLGL